ncbi:hypothetical protein AMJ49_06535 [Parcubacteria bacterium DG_74_2]|nr:MAG: hypothetical protein AMJ49_06535 [Parcubacteria bacterium DG_74_2]
MPKDIKNDVKLADLLPIQVITETTEGAAIDTRLADESRFASALARIAIGDLGDQTSTKVKIEESDNATFGDASETIAEGGEEITVAADNVYKMEITRKKRYLRAVVTIAGGSTPSAEVHINGILCDWGKPFPII